MQQTIAERVQMTAAQMVRPQTLKSRFWGREEGKGCETAWGGGIPCTPGLRGPRAGRHSRGGRKGGVGAHAHLEGPSGFIAGGVRGNFQFLP